MGVGARLLALVAALAVPGVAHTETLRSAVKTAVATNPSIEAVGADTKATMYDLLSLESEFQPVVRATGEAGSQWVDDLSSLSPSENKEAKFTRQIGLEAEVVLFDGLRRANLVYANAARVDGSIFRLLDASETLALNATEVYIDVFRHLNLQSLAVRNLARHREIGNQVGDLVDGGRLPLSDKLQIDDRIRAAELALVEIRRAGRDADARYRRIVGKKRTGLVSLPAMVRIPSSVTSVIETAVARNYRVRVANTEIDRAKFEQAVTASGSQPRITLNAGAKHGKNRDGARGSEADVFFGLRLNWVLYQGGRKAERNAMAQRKSKAISERNVAIREVRELAERSWNSYVANSQRARLLNAQLQSNQEIVEQYQAEFEAGTRSLLELLEAERAKFDVQFEKASADASLAFSTYRILAAQSRLAEHFGIKASDIALAPTFQQRAKVSPTAVFKTEIAPLE